MIWEAFWMVRAEQGSTPTDIPLSNMPHAQGEWNLTRYRQDMNLYFQLLPFLLSASGQEHGIQPKYYISQLINLW
jgi:hypothetical protein